MFTIKRKPRIPVHFLIHYLLHWMSMVLCVDGQPGCMEVTYLEVGKEGIISCSLEPFYAVSWYTKEGYDESMSPLLYFNGNKHGRVDEYDVHTNGSFIFRNVTFNHAGSYIVSMLRSATSDSFVREVYLGVYVTPDPTYPVIEGHIRQQHAYMDVSRNGQLSCSMRRVYPNISLAWTVVDPSQSRMILFQDDVVGSKQNEDKTFDITLTSLYKVIDQSIQSITIQCEVANEIGEVLSSRTEVDLLFSSVYPVVIGQASQKHVYLDVDREGHLICIKEKVTAGTTLVWKVVDPTLHGRISFQSNSFISHNKDDTININQTFDYIVHDMALERVAIECRVIEPDTSEHPYVTKVELLLGNVAVAVIDGCYSKQDHCALEVKRTAELTCTVKNSRYPVYLNWTVLDGGPFFDLGKSVVISQNKNDLFDTSITTPYTIIDKSSVSVQCVAKNANNGHLLSIAKAFLGVYSDSSNKSIHGTVSAFSLLTMFLVIVFGLIVIILWWCIRKMYIKQNHLRKCLRLECGGEMFGYSIPEDSDPTKQHTDLGLPVTCNSEAAFKISEDTDQDKSVDSLDSGNSGSTSGERSGSEASVQFSVMVDTVSSQSVSKQAQMLRTEENPEEVPMLQSLGEHVHED